MFLLGILVGVYLTKILYWPDHSIRHKHEPYVSQQTQRQVYEKYGTDSFIKVKYNHHDVPPVLHFIWISKHLSEPEHLPKRVLKNIKLWESLHPSDQIVLWTNAMVRRHFPELVPLFSKIKREAWIADILRYKIIARYGGVYLDTDIIAIKNIDHLRKNTLGFSVCERPTQQYPHGGKLTTKSCEVVESAVIAAQKTQK